MKKLLISFATVLTAIWVSSANAALSVSVFYDSLEPYGEWLDVGDYGYVWHPANVGAEWRPYTDGHWVFTDAGWTWLSDEPFGWATYHYGRWVNVVSTGWVWVPDTEWGPAWVSWRRSPRHIGWAPLPPEAQFRPTITISAWADAYYDIGPGFYSFVDVRQFGAPRLREVVLPPRENITIINETRNITNITYRNNVVYNGGPEYDVIARESAQPIRRLRLERRTEVDAVSGGVRSESFRSQVQGDALRVVAPSLEATAVSAPRHVARKVERAELDRGWKDVADKQQAEQLRTRLKAEAKPPPELPAKPKFERLVAKESSHPDKAGAAAVPTAPPATTVPGTPTAPSDKPVATAEQPLRTTDQATASSPATSGGAANAKIAKGQGKKAKAELASGSETAAAAGSVGTNKQQGKKKPRNEVTSTAPVIDANTPAATATEVAPPDRAGKAGKKEAKRVGPAVTPDVETSATLPKERPEADVPVAPSQGQRKRAEKAGREAVQSGPPGEVAKHHEVVNGSPENPRSPQGIGGPVEGKSKKGEGDRKKGKKELEQSQ
jgi:hypothetical protein